MTLEEKTLGGIIFLLMGCLAFALIFHSCEVQKYEAKLVELQNQAASKDQTIELKDGLYHKLALQSQDLQKLLDDKSKSVGELKDQLKKSKQDLLAVNEVTVGLKKQIEEMGKATQTEVPPANGKPGRTKVDFHDDFGVVKVDGWTITNPAQSWVRLSPGKPLKLSLAIAQDKDKAWHTYVTTDDDRYGVDIHLTAVDPYVLQPKWYEHIGVAVDLGIGSNASGLGALVGAGVNYQFMQFTLGPHVWLGLNNVVDKYYGLAFEWRPFQKTR